MVRPGQVCQYIASLISSVAIDGNESALKEILDMSEKLIDKLIDVLSVGNRPIRIFFFGGVLLAYAIMKLSGKLMGIDSSSSGDIDVPNAILMAVSILMGFAASYKVMRYLEINKQQNTKDDA